jgi:outer membrane protein OmpA-like peptidoglycan-associated protein
MSTNNTQNISRHWSGFRWIWWLITFILAALLLLMWAMGYGPNGKSCQIPEKIRTVEKLITAPDTAAPLITLNDNSVVRLISGDTYQDAGARAVDGVDGNLTVTTTGSVDTKTPGEYEITYSVTDAAGNATTEVRKVIVEAKDTEAPELTLVKDEVIYIKTGDLYVDEGAVATDIPDGELRVITEGMVDTSKAGEYVVTYSATDKAGNKSSLSRKVIVTDPDSAAPVLSLNGASVVNLLVGDAYNEEGAKAVDKIDGELTVTDVTGTVDTTKSGEYLIIYRVKDSAGNVAELARKVIVTAPDKTAPVITLKGDSPVTLNVGESYTEMGATAEDNEDGEVSVAVKGSIDSHSAGEYVITYTATDKASNTATETRKVIVVAAEVKQPEAAPEPEAVVSSVPKAKVYFGYDKANNPKDHDGSFAKVLSYMKNNDNATAMIYGFHDPSGDRNYNRGLANRRAETVSLVMMAAGIQSTRLIIKKPVETTGTGDPSEARRVEIDIK